MVRSIASSPSHNSAADRQEQAHAFVAEALARLATGGNFREDQILSAHPELHTELLKELELARTIRQAYHEARRAGQTSDSLQVLSPSDLEKPIDFGSDADGWNSNDVQPAIEGYYILQEISRGGQAAVYKALQESTRREVAIKVINGGPLVSSRHRVRFEREVEILATLSHPNIVGVLERGRTKDGSFFFVMDYIDGLPLDQFWKQRLERTREGTRKIVALFSRIADAVEEAHCHGVVHRDLKPSNIRVDERGEAHVLDFGLARSSDQVEWASGQTITVSGQIVGSLPWASPEQVAGNSSRVDLRSDVYSLGAMLYQAMADRLPQSIEGTIDEVILRIRTSPAAAPSRSNNARPGLDGVLDAIILKALQKEPDRRYPSAGGLAQDLELWLAGGRPAGLPGRYSRRRLLLAGAGTLVALAGVGAWGLHSKAAPYTVFDLPSITNSIGMKLVRISPTSFTMGSPYSEQDRDPHEYSHRVTLTDPYYIAVTEVTQGQYQKIMGANPSDAKTRGGDFPVQSVTWHEANEFCKRLSDLEHRRYRLPSEAEWEFACRAGDGRPFAGTGNLDEMGWYAGNSHGSTHPVGLKKPNVWGLYDMHGNVAEWCADVYSGVPGKTHSDLEGAPARVVRGGGALAASSQCRSASRIATSPEIRSIELGFRVVADAR